MSRSMYLVLLMVAAATVMFSCVQTIRNMKADAAAAKRPYGSFTESRIIARSRPIFSALLRGRDTLSLMAERQGDSWRGGPSHRLWNVQCVAEHNNVIASVLLDADTGKVQQVSGESLPDSALRGASRSISRAKAVSAALAWAERLGYRELWQVCAPQAASNTAWHIRLSTPERTANLCLDNRSATLVFASITGNYSRYTAAQVADMSRPLFRNLAPVNSALALKVERQEAMRHDGSTWRQWNVLCLDAHKNVVARLVRDADTGRICVVSREFLSETDRSKENLPMSCERAISAAKQWVKLLGYTEDDWHASDTLPRSNKVWHIQLAASGKTALLMLDKHTGNLNYALIPPKP